jgi:uncharacterized sodium:solute symporter family permease YidK
MTKKLSEIAGPVLTALAFPIAMLAFPSITTVKILWMGAILTLAIQAGIAVSKHISKRQAAVLLAVAVVGLAAAWLVGWVRFDSSALEHSLGAMALVIVALTLPLHALIPKLREDRETGRKSE